ncbi:copper amine oxidase N-terminal domain-containing protein [Cohnella soli]|uniref:Copper amine oxidase N-terminal domain-containing protein n=1 Tax=Cohnella soli TaxID=425005 RepID=A0ABW0HXN9_9BACL
MKKFLACVVLSSMLVVAASPTYAASGQIKIDGVAVVSDAKPETKNSRIMVPLRTISENLGAKVEWFKSEVTLTKNDIKVTLKPNSKSAAKNGKTIQLDAAPYIKNDRMFVPIRFISETFGCTVDYSKSTVSVTTSPLVIDGVTIGALQQEYHMTMGGVVQHINGNAYKEAIYRLFTENRGEKTEAPADYSWRANYGTPGSYYKGSQFDFLDKKGKSIKRFDLYSLTGPSDVDTLPDYPDVLIHDVSENQWYVSSLDAKAEIMKAVDTAFINGFVKIISNTVA